MQWYLIFINGCVKNKKICLYLMILRNLKFVCTPPDVILLSYSSVLTLLKIFSKMLKVLKFSGLTLINL